MPQKPRHQPPYIPITRLYNLDNNSTAQTLDHDHSGIMADLWHFTCNHSEDENIRYQFVAVIVDRCHKAILFEASRTSNKAPKQRHDNRNEQAARRLKEYRNAANKAADSIGQVMDFLKCYQDSPGLNDSLFLYDLKAKHTQITVNGAKPMTISDAVFTTMRDLKAALTAPATAAFHNYAFRYGVLSYPIPVHWKGGELPTTARMLALQLTTYMRWYSIGEPDNILGQGLTLTNKGKPAHALIDRIVKAALPQADFEQVIAKPTERYFKDKYPGLYLLHWPTP